MSHRIRSLLVAFLGVAIIGSAANAQRNTRPVPGIAAIPAGAELGRFPIEAGPLSAPEMARLGLRPVPLDSTRVFHNWNRSIKHFQLDTLRAGTIVLVDRDNVVRYKADCGNRLVEDKSAKVGPLNGTGSGSSGSGSNRLGGVNGGAGNSGAPKADVRGPIHRLADALANFAKAVWSGPMWAGIGNGVRGLFWLAAALLGILLLPLLVYLLYRWWQGRAASSSASSSSAYGGPATTGPVSPAPRPAPSARDAGAGGVSVPPRAAIPVTSPAARTAAGGPTAASAENGGVATALADAPDATAAAATGAQASNRRFVSFIPATEDGQHTLHFSGLADIHHEAHEDGSHTLHYRHA